MIEFGSGLMSTKKLKSGSKITIGNGTNTASIANINQRFNWLQKKMLKFLLGIKVENYSEED